MPPKGKKIGKSKPMQRNSYLRANRGLKSKHLQGVYRFKRSTMNPLIQAASASGSFLWSTAAQSPVFVASVNQLPNWADFSSLFDMYRIDKVVLHFEPMFTGRDMTGINYKTAGAPVPSTSVLTGSLKYIRVVTDYNDSTSLTSENEALEYQNCKSYKIGQAFKVTLYPKLQSMVYRTAVTTGYETTKPKFLPTSDNVIPHYGIKFWLSTVSGDANDLNNNLAIYNIKADYYLTMKNVK